jgi:hypothetical protein
MLGTNKLDRSSLLFFSAQSADSVCEVHTDPATPGGDPQSKASPVRRRTSDTQGHSPESVWRGRIRTARNVESEKTGLLTCHLALSFCADNMSMANTIPRANMQDPIPPPSMLVQLSKPFAESLGLSTMPYHVHEILLGFLGYHLVLYVLSPAISQIVCPQTYRGFNKHTRLNWDIHWVSMIQALFINTAALWVIFKDEQRHEMDWKGRLWGYTPASGMVRHV